VEGPKIESLLGSMFATYISIWYNYFRSVFSDLEMSVFPC